MDRITFARLVAALRGNEQLFAAFLADPAGASLCAAGAWSSGDPGPASALRGCGPVYTCCCTSYTCAGVTCGGVTCDVTCTATSCGNTCGNSCGFTTNIEPAFFGADPWRGERAWAAAQGRDDAGLAWK